MTEIVFISDSSGSMSGLEKDTIGDWKKRIDADFRKRRAKI